MANMLGAVEGFKGSCGDAGFVGGVVREVDGRWESFPAHFRSSDHFVDGIYHLLVETGSPVDVDEGVVELKLLQQSDQFRLEVFGLQFVEVGVDYLGN